MSSFEDRLSLTDIAALAEVGVTAVSNWRKRHPDFPGARRSSGQELFIAGEIAQWLRDRKVPRNRCRAGEGSGSTYGERFLRNLGIADPASTAAVTTAETGPIVGGEQRLRAAAELLRDHYDAASSAEFMLGLLYLKIAEPELWQGLIREFPEGKASRDLLAQTELPSGPGAPRVPLFRMSALTPMVDGSLVELAHAIDVIDFGSSHGASSIAAQVCDGLLAQIAREMGRQGGHFTPDSLARCMIELADPRSQDLVYDPFCGSGELLAAAAAHVERSGGKSNGLRISGQARSEWSWRMTKINLALHEVSGKVGIHLSDALREDPFPGMQFDVVLANPPFNVTNWAPESLRGQNWPYGVPPAGNANFAWLQHVAAKLAPGGRAAVLMPNGASTTRKTAEAAIRARMVDAGVIECVVALPEHLFRATLIPVSLWILRGAGHRGAPEILFIDATGMGAMADRVQRVLTDEDINRIQRELQAWRARQSAGRYEATTGFARSVAPTEIRATDYMLSPPAYVRPAVPPVRPERSLILINELRSELADLQGRSMEVRAMLDAQLAGLAVGPAPEKAPLHGWAMTQLGEACDVLAGPGAVDRGERQQPPTPLVLPRNIKQNRITDVDLDTVDPLTAAKLARYRLAPGDVVCTRTGTLGRYGLVQDEQEDWLLGPGCMRLRPKEQILPSYLTYYLSSPAAYGWLMDNATGSAIRQINTETLNRMPLALPPLSTQREIAAVLGAFDAEIAIHGLIGATTQALRDTLLPLLMAGAAR
jgi:type I restriction enzyme M protein